MSGTRTPTPHLTYCFLRESGDGIEGDGWELHTVHEVSASRFRSGDLRMWARGRMLRRDGQPGPSRGLEIDIAAPQPAWLRRIIADATRRLGTGATRTEDA